MYFNLDPFYYRFLIGDKDLFAMAWNAMGSPLAHGGFSGVIGYRCAERSNGRYSLSSSSDTVCGVQFTRNDLQNRPLFIHHLKQFKSQPLEDGTEGSPWQVIREVRDSTHPVGLRGVRHTYPVGSGQVSMSGYGTVFDLSGDVHTLDVDPATRDLYLFMQAAVPEL